MFCNALTIKRLSHLLGMNVHFDVKDIVICVRLGSDLSHFLM
ncbi:hypothetical protein HMPREF9145_0803 [Segatella salivae F0493]|uniref:Uncharacterized protein n=1 Tax=Segatella salivae F0493 TaxID=1395125 RepID=U2MKA7_9BACT|nr:hypothetical protein HMPREF9145_0803 [Segatella salivae F0493]